jgi:hypothetical protein
MYSTGELSATCKGPTLPAFCKLEDQRDGTFKLTVTPQEVGGHHLRVTFNGDSVPGTWIDANKLIDYRNLQFAHLQIDMNKSHF